MLLSITEWTLYAVLFLALLIASQDLHIFPGALLSLTYRGKRKPGSLAPGIESCSVRTSDDQQLEVWRLAPAPGEQVQDCVAIIFHGNGGCLPDFLYPQLWLLEQGIVSYGFDYRGFGYSSGWPSEKGLYQDGEAVCQYVLAREKIAHKRLILVGISLGGAPAAHCACKFAPGTLLLSSAFCNLPQVVREHWLLRPLAVFVRYQFSTEAYIVQLGQNTRLILCHGKQDRMVSVRHAERLRAAYTGNQMVELIVCPESSHNNVFYSQRRQLAAALARSLKYNP